MAVVQVLLREGAHINQCDNMGFSPLHATVKAGQINIAQILIANNADLNHKATDGSTPPRNVYSQLCEMIIRNRANVNASINNGQSPLFVAAEQGYANIVKMF